MKKTLLATLLALTFCEAGAQQAGIGGGIYGLKIPSGTVLSGDGKALSAATTTGTGTTVVLSTSPTLVTPLLGTPTSLIGTNISGTAASLTAGNVTTNANLTGPITSTGNATAVAAQTGTGSTFVMQATPTLTTPNIGAATGTSLAMADGTSSAPSHTFSSETGVGFYRNGTQQITFASGTNARWTTSAWVFRLDGTNGVLGFSSGSTTSTSADSGFSRLGAASIAMGNGTAGNASGTFTAATVVASTGLTLAGTSITGVTGTGNAVLAASPTITGTLAAAAITGTTGGFTSTLSFGANTLSSNLVFGGIGTGATITGTEKAVAEILQDRTTHRGLQFGYDSSGQIGLIVADSVGAASTIKLVAYSGSAWTDSLTVSSSAVSTAGTLTVGTINAGTGVFMCESAGLVLSGATTCVASSKRFKNPLDILAPAQSDRLNLLQASIYTYKDQEHNAPGERVGLYAEDVAKMDSRCGEYNKDGELMTYDDRCVIAYLVADRQNMRKRIDKLEAAIDNMLKK